MGRGVAEPSPAEGPSRRQFLTRAVVGGAVLTAGSALAATTLLPAGAQEDGEKPPELTGDNREVAFLASLALAAAGAYQMATAEGSPLTEPVQEVVRTYVAHHNTQATVLNGQLPEALQIVVANPTLAGEMATSLGGDDADAILESLRSLEQNLAATHFAALGEVEDPQAAAVVVSTLPVLDQQAVVLGSLAGLPMSELLIDEQTDEGAYYIDDYPVIVGAPEEGEEGSSTTVVGPTDSTPTDGSSTTEDTGEGAEDAPTQTTIPEG